MASAEPEPEPDKEPDALVALGAVEMAHWSRPLVSELASASSAPLEPVRFFRDRPLRDHRMTHVAPLWSELRFGHSSRCRGEGSRPIATRSLIGAVPERAQVEHPTAAGS